MGFSTVRAQRESGPPPATLRPVGGPRAATGAGRRGRADFWAVLALLAPPVAITAWGWRYYTLAPAGRLRHPLHALLKPSGPIGLWLGVAGLALFLFMWAYAIRKSARWLSWTGAIGSWLRVHIVIGLALPVIVAVHAGWRFDGLIGLGYLSMFVVALSGIVGRYLYTHIPRRRNGVEMSIEDVSQERRTLLTHIAAVTGLEPMAVERALAVDPAPYQGLDPIRTVMRLIRDDFQRGRMIRQLREQWSRPRPDTRPLDDQALDDTLRLARREIRLQQEVHVLDAARRLFGAWHVFHRPFAATALIAVLVHVVVAIWVGGVGGFSMGR